MRHVTFRFALDALPTCFLVTVTRSGLARRLILMAVTRSG